MSMNPRNPGARLWRLVQGDPAFMRSVNGWLTLFWVAMIPVSMLLGWLESVVYVSALSLWALVSGHWAAWQGARVEANEVHAEQQRHVSDLKRYRGVSRSMRVRAPRRVRER